MIILQNKQNTEKSMIQVRSQNNRNANHRNMDFKHSSRLDSRLTPRKTRSSSLDDELILCAQLLLNARRLKCISFGSKMVGKRHTFFLFLECTPLILISVVFGTQSQPSKKHKRPKRREIFVYFFLNPSCS